MEHSSAAMIVDARGTVTGWSDGARRLTGYAAEEVVGRPARGLLARDLLARGAAPGGLLSGAPGATAGVRHRHGPIGRAHYRKTVTSYGNSE
ncbi:PAS domain S-box protein, partial [Streptomyces sp. NPDC044948]|uniref:PAS domain S-box protein n=1 Tax=Streptomyces sp. NPDC044948 TaxID=3157092 RepID=UPI0033FDB59D